MMSVGKASVSDASDVLKRSHNRTYGVKSLFELQVGLPDPVSAMDVGIAPGHLEKRKVRDRRGLNALVQSRG
jgi:hypothetical protein